MGTLGRSVNVPAEYTVGGLIATFLVACGTGNPTAPTRYGPASLIVSCSTAGTAPLLCTARIVCSLYPCSPDTPTDVTSEAVWASEDPTVVRIVEPGAVEAVGTGDTLVRVRWQYLDGQRTVSVFAGTPPLPTHEIFGSVYEAGKTVAVGPIAGATIEVMSGLLAGRSATSGMPPPLLPGFFGPLGGPAYYRILGVPPGSYRLRVRKEGYVTQERDVPVSTGSPNADFQLSPL